MSAARKIRCPHCGHEFAIDIKNRSDSTAGLKLRFMGVSKAIGKPKYINVNCQSCRRNITLKT